MSDANYVSLDGLISTGDKQSQRRQQRPEEDCDSDEGDNDRRSARRGGGSGGSGILYPGWQKIKIIVALFIIYMLINTEAFIYHVMRRIPGAVRPSENITTGVGTVVQAIIMVAIFALMDVIVSNGWIL